MRINILTRITNRIESILKFPNLKKGEIGIQVGFDLSSKNLTSDVIKMNYRAGNSGLIIAIDPDPFNHEQMSKVIDNQKLNIKLVQIATSDKKTKDKLILGSKASYNKIERFEKSDSSDKDRKKIEIEMDTLDSIIKKLDIDYSKIKHIAITNNGAEYDTLLGMSDIFNKVENLNLTIASGRPDEMGDINGRRDYELIMEFLNKLGFSTKFIRLNKSFWRGFVISLIVKRKWVYNKTRFGFIIASRGNRKLKWYQSLY